MNKVQKLNKIQKSGEQKLTICCSFEDIEGDRSITNKHKVRIIYSKTSFAPTSYLRECLNQILQAQQILFTAMTSLAKPSVFSRLSFTSRTLRSVVSILERSRYGSKKSRKKIKLAMLRVNMVGRGNRTLCPDSPPKISPPSRLKGSTATRGQEPDQRQQVNQLPPSQSISRRGK